MNEFLAEMYGTRETIGAPSQSDEVEKLAEANLLDQALQAEGVNIDDLPADTILKVAYELFGEKSALVKAAMHGPKRDDESDEEYKARMAMHEECGAGDTQQVNLGMETVQIRKNIFGIQYAPYIIDTALVDRDL